MTALTYSASQEQMTMDLPDLSICEDMITKWNDIDEKEKLSISKNILKKIEPFLAYGIRGNNNDSSLATMKGQILWEIFQQKKRDLILQNVKEKEIDEKIESILYFIAETFVDSVIVEIPLHQVANSEHVESTWGEHGAHFQKGE